MTALLAKIKHPMRNNPIFTPAESVYLDLTRFALAMLVLACHISEPFFESSFSEKIEHVGVMAVGGFFVLSGYTIAAIKSADPSAWSPNTFLIDRASRLLSVSIPALVLTLLLDGLTYGVAPNFYLDNWAGNAHHAIVQIVASMLFLGQSHGYSFSVLSNSPFWSLSYEMGFYLLYAIGSVIIVKPKNWPYFLLAAGVFGHNILFVFTLWLSGIAQHKICTSSHYIRQRWAFSIICATLVYLEIYHTDGRIDSVYGLIKFAADSINISLARVNQDLILGILIYNLIQTQLLPLVRVLRDPPDQLLILARKAGEITFPIYLFHFPVLVAAKGLGLWPDHTWWADALVALGAILISYALLPFCDRIKSILRHRARIAIKNFN